MGSVKRARGGPPAAACVVVMVACTREWFDVRQSPCSSSCADDDERGERRGLDVNRMVVAEGNTKSGCYYGQ